MNDPLEDAARVMFCQFSEKDVWTLKSSKTPLDYLLQRDRYQILSHKAKEVIDLVLKEEREPRSVISRIENPKSGEIEKRRLMKVLRELGWSLKNIKEAFDEIAYFVRSL